MLPATTWDDADWTGAQARGWTVMRRLRERERIHTRDAKVARKRLASREQVHTSSLMTAAQGQQEYEDSIKARWRGGPTVLALLFAHPGCHAMRMLDARGGYFDCRTGDTWDLFFPGYYRSTNGRLERETGARPVGRGHTSDWYFSAADFDTLRRHVEGSSEGRWKYSGGTDLVLINGYLVSGSEPVIDWKSTISGQVTDRATGTDTLTLAEVVERLSRDLETAIEDPAYGVGDVVNVVSQPRDHSTIRAYVVSSLAGITAALTSHGIFG